MLERTGERNNASRPCLPFQASAIGALDTLRRDSMSPWATDDVMDSARLEIAHLHLQHSRADDAGKLSSGIASCREQPWRQGREVFQTTTDAKLATLRIYTCGSDTAPWTWTWTWTGPGLNLDLCSLSC